jgi:hypothetical protein
MGRDRAAVFPRAGADGQVIAILGPAEEKRKEKWGPYATTPTRVTSGSCRSPSPARRLPKTHC